MFRVRSVSHIDAIPVTLLPVTDKDKVFDWGDGPGEFTVFRGDQEDLEMITPVTPTLSLSYVDLGVSLVSCRLFSFGSGGESGSVGSGRTDQGRCGVRLSNGTPSTESMKTWKGLGSPSAVNGVQRRTWEQTEECRIWGTTIPRNTYVAQRDHPVRGWVCTCECVQVCVCVYECVTCCHTYFPRESMRVTVSRPY